jgi:RimJ/RimL family protein N-acetyltransferase
MERSEAEDGAVSDSGGGERPILNLVGEKVALGPLHAGLLPLIAAWSNDFATATLSGDDPRPHSPAAIEAECAPLLKGERAGWVGFAIYELATLRPIGHGNIRDVGSVHRTAEFGIVIGEADCRGKGYGTEATLLMLDYAFTALGLHNVWLDTLSFNERAIAAYRRAGFREIGRRREAHRIGDRVYDVVLMDCLATEFRTPLRRLSEEG